jgi:hypothetical protein
MLVSLDQARAQTKADTTDGDTHLTLLIKAASIAVLNYIRNGADEFTDSAGDAIEDSSGNVLGVPEDVQLAVLYLVAWFDKNRDSDQMNEFSRGWLPAPVVTLLGPYRDPGMA